MEARDAGAHEYLAKPISARSLYSRINSIISHLREIIKTRTFFGPDRRIADGVAAAPDAAAAPVPAMADAGEDAGLSQAELDVLFD